MKRPLLRPLLRPLPLLLLCLVCLLCLLPAGAQDAPAYPTVDALAAAGVPPRDRVDLARRLLGVFDLPPPIPGGLPRIAGTRQTFWALNVRERRTFQVDATLRAVGSHVYVWVQDGANVPDADAVALAQTFDQAIYAPVRALWGGEDSPGVDGDPRIYILAAHNLGEGVVGFFYSAFALPGAVLATSNQHEMFFINLDATGLAHAGVYSLLGHEFQHMIRAHLDPNEDTWFNEGLSTFTERYLGYDNPLGAAYGFLLTPYTQLNTWSADALPHYGASFLFLTYLAEQRRLTALQTAAASPARGMDAVAGALGADDAGALFADWVLANFLGRAGTRWGYAALPPAVPQPPFTPLDRLPYTVTRRAAPYTTDYTLLTAPPGDTLTVRLTLPPDAALTAADLAGGFAWYGNRADNSDTTLTCAADLTGLTAAALEYRLWHQLEDGWDYAYVFASSDDGVSWTALTAPGMTASTPYGRAYTGDSGGWRTESIALDAFAGSRVLLRFEVLTDDALTLPGVLLDDVRVTGNPACSSDFDASGAGWQAQGWARVDNRLPAAAWLQVVQLAGETVDVARLRVPADGDALVVPLLSGVERVLVAVSPFAPLTTEPLTYTLEVR